VHRVNNTCREEEFSEHPSRIEMKFRKKEIRIHGTSWMKNKGFPDCILETQRRKSATLTKIERLGKE
jgi:hypothetical protein